MSKKIWDRYAPIYERSMRSDKEVYNMMYERIPTIIKDKYVLEIGTGPGLLAKNVAYASKKMIATDYSEGMINQAKKNDYPDNLSFEIADAKNLPYEDNSFDVVLIASTLHVMKNPEKALEEIHRVLKDDGILIAPNFIKYNSGIFNRVWEAIIRIAGVKFEHDWTTNEYIKFLTLNGWEIDYMEEILAKIPIVYVECVKKNR